MEENLRYDFIRQRQNRVLVGVESLAHYRFLGPQCKKGAPETKGPGELKIQYVGFDICDATTICFKGGEHRGETHTESSTATDLTFRFDQYDRQFMHYISPGGF
jgi:hypothetical protein